MDTDSNDVAGSCIANESDVRLKTNITTIENALDKISQLRGVEFDWRVNDPDIIEQHPLITRFASQPHSLGLIAQEVEEVFPEAISMETFNGFKQLEYDKLAAPMVEAIKELKAEVEELKSENQSILSQNQALLSLVCLDHPEADICQ